MYKLYTNQEIINIQLETVYSSIHVGEKCFENLFLQNDMVITLTLPTFYDPKLWLYNPFQNVIAYNLKKYCEHESLDLYINTIYKAKKYYTLGEKSLILISFLDENDTILITKTTIDMLLQRSIYCNKPFIHEMEFEVHN